MKLGNVSVRVMKNRHPPLTESYAVAFETAAARIVFSGDTTYFDGMAAFARGADLLVHEVMFGPGIERVIARVGLGDKLRHHLVTSHTLAEDVGRVAADAAVRALALHHFVPGDDPDISADDWTAAVRRHYQGPLHIGRDGLEIRLGQTVR